MGLDVDMPLTDEDDHATPETENQNTSKGDEVGTSSTTPNEKGNGTITENVVGQGSVTITTEEVTFKETVVAGNADMEHVKSETNPIDINDLVHAGDVAAEPYLPGYTEEPVILEGVDGYEYVYVGSGNTSKFVPAIVFTKPLTDEGKVAMYGSNAYLKDDKITYYYVGCLPKEVRETIQIDENGNYVTNEDGFILDRILKEELVTTGPDGETYYLYRFDKTFDGL